MQPNRVDSATSPPQSEKVEIRIARSLAEVEALRKPWEAWPGHRDSDIDFYTMIVQSYPEVVRPHVIALYRDGKPEAILVGRLERKRLGFNVGYLAGFRPWARCLTFVYDAIHGDASPECTRLLLREVMSCLQRGEADVAMLEFVRLDCPAYRLARTMPGLLSRDTLPASQGHSTMTVPDNVDQVYARMSRARRKHTRASVRGLRINPAGEPSVVCYRNQSDLNRLFNDAEKIAKKTYQRGLGVGFADTPSVRRRLSLAADKGWLRAYILYLGDRPCAFWIGMAYLETFVSEYMGYDPEFRRFSPGMVLIMDVIERFCKRVEGDTIKRVDFGLGDAEYKQMLGDNDWLEATLYIFSRSTKGLALKAMRTMARVVDGSLRGILNGTRFAPRLKRAWRERVAKRSRKATYNLAPNGPTVSAHYPPICR